MFSSALKSFSSNISSNYIISPQPSSTSGPWKIFDAKRKQTGRAATVFLFDRKALEPAGGGLGTSSRGGSASLKRAHDEVLERLKREASSLARLRHPSILELAEPVEETRNGGLMFATEAVTASLASLLADQDEQDRAGAGKSRGRRYVVDGTDGPNTTREFELDELEIQKGLLQLGKGLEFLHESAGLVHGNLSPEAIMVNSKGDWKISGFAFCGPHESSTAATSLTPIQLSEVLNHDPRLPRNVQLDMDFTSPDFVLDNRLTSSADMFSLGLVIISLYNSPHASPLGTSGSLSAYKRLFSSSSSLPTRTNNFLVPSSHPIPAKLVSELLPRLITRRPAQRLSAREFQEAPYFDNILVSTIRFLDALPAKTPNEKVQFMRGLPRIVAQFPRGVLEKKVLPALLEETKDRELLAPILTNIFAMLKVIPAGKRAFTDQVVPKLRDVFNPGKTAERDTSKEAGLMILLENMQTAADNCSGKEFREDILPIIVQALESPTHGLVDAAFQTLPHVLPVLDFSTIKNELFPVVANVFAKTSSLNIKIRGLEAFYTLCGGSATAQSIDDDDLSGIGVTDKKAVSSSSSAILDKFTVQEKIVPLLKGIKTKEPGVMMAALRVFQQVGEVADSDFLAMDVLPILWGMSLGPLLDLQQFQAFMSLIKKLSGRIEREHTKKLQEMSSTGDVSIGTGPVVRGGRQLSGRQAGLNDLTIDGETDFEALVSGRKPVSATGNDDLMNDWGNSATATRASTWTTLGGQQNSIPTSGTLWQASQSQAMAGRRTQMPGTSRAITPDHSLSTFAPLTPASQFSQPLQPMQSGRPSAISSFSSRPAQLQSQVHSTTTNGGTSIDWSAAVGNQVSTWASPTSPPLQHPSTGAVSAANRSGAIGYSIRPPPTSPQPLGGPKLPVVQPNRSSDADNASQSSRNVGIDKNTGSFVQLKSGLDKYESLI